MRGTPSPGSKPWYAQFWPWVLIGLPVISVVFSVATLVVAIRNGDSLVRDDWYTRGLAINRDLGRAEAAVRLGVGATVNVDAARDELVVTLEGDDGLTELEVELEHPTEARRARTYHLAPSGPGTYRGALGGELSGRWYVSLGPPSGAWRLTAPLTLVPGTAVRLAPQI